MSILLESRIREAADRLVLLLGEDIAPIKHAKFACYFHGSRQLLIALGLPAEHSIWRHLQHSLPGFDLHSRLSVREVTERACSLLQPSHPGARSDEA